MTTGQPYNRLSMAAAISVSLSYSTKYPSESQAPSKFPRNPCTIQVKWNKKVNMDKHSNWNKWANQNPEKPSIGLLPQLT